MPKGALRLAIEDFFFTNLEPEGGPGWWARVKARWNEYKILSDLVKEQEPGIYNAKASQFQMGAIVYALTGAEIFVDTLREILGQEEQGDISQQVAEMMSTIFAHPAAAEVAEVLGAVITDPVINIFEQYAGRDDTDPKEFARAFHGFMIGLNVSGGLADTVLESVTGGQVEGAGRFLNSMYWSLGLGFLGWQTLAPLLESGLQPGLSRYYNKLYRPMRFTAGDLRDLYALGEMSQDELAEGAQFLGWRDQDIAKWIQLAFRTMSQGDIWKLLHEGHINENEAVARLRALGYDPADIPLLFAINPRPETDEARAFAASTARQAYREGIIPVAELRAVLENLNYTGREIDVIIALEDSKRETDLRTLTVGQIKSAWLENVLTDTEAVHWLGVEGFGSGEITILMDTWRAEAIPEFRQLNAGTIVGAYVEGVLTRSQARDKLMAVGFTDEDANLELDLAEARNPEAFGRPVPPPTRELTASTLSDLLGVGLITPEIMTARLIEIGYPDADAALLTEAAIIRTAPVARAVPQRSVERAYVAGVIDRDAAFGLLLALGISPEGANIILDTLEAEEPEAFGAPPEERIKELTAGVLEDLLIGGLITADEMRTRLVELGYSTTDAALLTDRAVQVAAPLVRPIGQSSIERAYLAGIFDRDEAFNALLGLQLSSADAETILDTLEAENPVVFGAPPEERIRELGPAVLEDLLIGGLITSSQMLEYLLALGFSETDAGLLVERGLQFVAPFRRLLSQDTIERAYVAGVIDRTQALEFLALADFEPEDAERIILTVEQENPLVFDPEIVTSTRQPSIGALVAALQFGIITEAEYFARAQEIGYSVEDAHLYLSLVGTTERKSTRKLSQAQIVRGYGKGLIPRGMGLSRLAQLGYNDADATMLLRIQMDFVENTDTWDMMLAGKLDAWQAIAALVNVPYADQDIVDAFAKLPPGQLAALGVDLRGLAEGLALTPGGA